MGQQAALDVQAGPFIGDSQQESLRSKFSSGPIDTVIDMSGLKASSTRGLLEAVPLAKRLTVEFR